MEVKIQSVGFKADAKLKEFTIKKINKLENFSDTLISAEVFFKVANASDEENKEAEVRIAIPGNDLFAKKQGKSFEEAIDNVVEALRRQIIKIKGKQEK
ncbi:MAG: ribosome-associated translation inhibitor RaiA [Bacteroidales bacterium]|jgi:putative sigma-54 modulation protein|nr:ribosome-associated translation inhibitor RaiA [Bacteroidales bacterium]